MSSAVLSPMAEGSGSVPTVATPAPPQRVGSIDAYRGLVMLLMMGEVLELGDVSKALPASGLWRALAQQQTHVQWRGCTLHDMIQPSFSFLVGAALPFSLARRASEGQPQWVRTTHAFWRALVLVLLGVFLRSQYSQATNWTFEDTLSQIGLGFGFLYLIALRPAREQWAALAAILIGYWTFFAVYPLPGEDFVWGTAGVTPAWPHWLHGPAAHWNKNTNAAWAFDTWFLNLFPREKPFTNNGGGYSTLSFIPTLGTMVAGLLAGGVLRSERKSSAKLGWLLLVGIAGIAIGWGLDAAAMCPVVKRIWTPSWVLFSGGICMLSLAGFYVLVDLWRQKWAVFWLTIVGVNSIAAYLIAHLFVSHIRKALVRHLGAHLFTLAGSAYDPVLIGAGTLLVEWLLLFWMYRRKIFLRV